MFKTQNRYQNDERGKNTRPGNSSETIGGWGCLVRCLVVGYILTDKDLRKGNLR